MAEITSTGITIKSLLEWKQELENIYLSVDPEWDISTSTPDGQIIAAFAEILTNADESILDAYSASDPDKALSQSLDALLRLTDIERKDGTYSTATVQLSGTVSTAVSAGTLIENSVTGTQWALDSDVTLLAGPTDASVTCTTLGAENGGIGELSKIATPVSGLDSVNNSASAIAGQNAMTDPEARLYRLETISKNAGSIADSIHGAVANTDGVTHVKTYNNRTAVTDANGVPGHSVALIVSGGTNLDVATSIYSKILPGPGMYGGSNPVTQEVVSSLTGNSEDVTFGRPTSTPLYLIVNIEDYGNLPATAVDDIKQNIINYAAGNLFDSDTTPGFVKRSWKIGEDISSGMLHTPVNYYLGQHGNAYVTSILISDSPTPTTAGTVVIDWDALATIDTANIDVVIA